MMRKLAIFFGFVLLLVGCVNTRYADGMMHVGHLMGPEAAVTSASGDGILTETSVLITTESGAVLRTE